jgi:predicted ATPase
MIGQEAVDFWSWQGGAFFFTRLFAAEAGVIDSHKLTDAAISSLHTLPPHSRDFVGRVEEIHHLTEALKSGKNVVIHGMVGIGKTELAIYLASRVRDHYPDAQLFVSLHGTTVNPFSTADGLRQLIHVFQPAADLPDDVTTLKAVYRSLLHNKRALIVVDDVPDSYSAHPFIPPAGSVMILTSRNAFTLPGATVFHMAGLSLAESVRLLLSIAPRIGSYAEQIAQICGGLPLALRLAASALSRSRSLSPADLVLRLQDRQKRLQLIEASLSSSYELLDERLRLYWRQLSVFPDYFDASGAAACLES